MNTTQKNNYMKIKVEDVDTFKIQSFLTICRIISVLIVILSIALAIVSFATANEEHTGIYASGRTYTYKELNGSKIGAGVGYLIGGFVGGIFLWKFSDVFCSFLCDIKAIKALIIQNKFKGVEENND